jgi:hypothetical protein
MTMTIGLTFVIAPAAISLDEIALTWRRGKDWRLGCAAQIPD